MTRPSYTLDIISHHPSFKNEALRKYGVNGIDTIGVWGEEKFSIKFTNNTWQKVQVKISIDGTDVFTGKQATTDVTKNMWVVNGYGTLELNAWPETDHGGAEFIFSNKNNSVAAHTHGNTDHLGIIAAAVYVEGHVEQTFYYPVINNFYKYGHSACVRTKPYLSDYYTICSNDASTSYGDLKSYASFNCGNDSLDLESTAAVGAGQYTEQEISYVQGLIKPVFMQSIRVRYVWYDDLISSLKKFSHSQPHPTGFPADKNAHIKLGGVPRVGEIQKTISQEQVYPRF